MLTRKKHREPGTAVIVEPRKHRAMKFVLKNILNNLDSAWRVQIFHGTANAAWLKRLLTNHFTKRQRARITLVGLKRDNLSQEEYNQTITSPHFWNQIPTERVIIFQTDSMICPPNRDLLDSFLHYDYVGAPWRYGIGVGNGGFSFRKKSKMLEVIAKCTRTGHHEDAYFSSGCEGVVVNKPTEEEAKAFSMESIYHPRTFGVHRPWASELKIDLPTWEGQCPGITHLHSLQKLK